MPDETEASWYEGEPARESSSGASPSVQKLDPEWRMQTLVRAVGRETALEFFWKAETDTIQTYEHRLTYRYVHIDSITGEFCNQERAPISTERALAHALPRAEPPLAMSMLAPIVVEPNLLPFFRHASARAEGQNRLEAGTSQSPGLERAPRTLVSVYHLLRSKMLNLGAHAKARASAHKLDHPTERTANLAGRDLSLAAFTRKTA